MKDPLPTVGRFIHQLGSTPLVPLELEPGPPIWAKLEFLNPSGSTKDRIARYMLEKAWRLGQIARGSRVVEASSGSTSISLALVSAQLGLRFTAVMPEGVSEERRLIIRAYGGDVVLTPKADGIGGSLEKAAEIAATTGALYTRQFENLDNSEAHRVWTAQEVLSQIPGSQVDAIVSGVGTGGTLVGMFEAFREAGCDVRPFAARPVTGSAVSEVECCSFSARVPGVVAGISKIYQDAELPGLLELDVADDLALETARRLIRGGFPVGPSSGLNLAAAHLAREHLRPNAQIVTVFPDRMERYFSTELFGR